MGTVESENLLLERGKENLVSVKMGNINPVIFLLFNNFFPCTPPSPAALLLSLQKQNYPNGHKALQKSVGMDWAAHLVLVVAGA